MTSDDQRCVVVNTAIFALDDRWNRDDESCDIAVVDGCFCRNPIFDSNNSIHQTNKQTNDSIQFNSINLANKRTNQQPNQSFCDKQEEACSQK